MKHHISAIIGWALLTIAFGLYIYGIYFAIFTPLHTIDQNKRITGLYIPDPLDSILSTIGAILLTNLGAVLGISVANPSSGLASKTIINRKMELIKISLSKRETIQYFAVILYLTVLVVCFISWAYGTFREDENKKLIVAIVAQNGKTLIGVIAAYIAFVIGTNKS